MLERMQFGRTGERRKLGSPTEDGGPQPSPPGCADEASDTPGHGGIRTEEESGAVARHLHSGPGETPATPHVYRHLGPKGCPGSAASRPANAAPIPSADA